MPLYPLRPDPDELFATSAKDLVHSANTSAGARLASSDSEVCPDSSLGAHSFRVCPPAGDTQQSRRNWLTGLAATGLIAWTESNAHAGATRAIDLEALVQASSHVLVGTPRDGSSVWEQDRASRRIVTYTRLTIEEVLGDTEPSDAELMIRTLGGQVGPLGQVVHGEAELKRDEACVAFVRAHQDGTFRLTALAQGHYPLMVDREGGRRLTTSPRLGDFFGKEVSSAVARLRGQTVQNARHLVRGAQRGK